MPPMGTALRVSSPDFFRPNTIVAAMSKTSTHNPEPLDEELIELLGAGIAAPIRDEEAEEIAGVLGTIRGQLLAAAKVDRVSTREMARRLGVSAAAVSRQLRSDRDLRVSTAVLLARALKRHWNIELGTPRPSTWQTNVEVVQLGAPFSRLEEPPNAREPTILSIA